MDGLAGRPGAPVSPHPGHNVAPTVTGQAEIKQQPGGQSAPQTYAYDEILAAEPVVTVLGKYPEDREAILRETVVSIAILHHRQANRNWARDHRVPGPNNILVARYTPLANDPLVDAAAADPWYHVIQTDPLGLLYGLTPDQQANTLAAASSTDKARERDIADALRDVCHALARTALVYGRSEPVTIGPTPDVLRKALAVLSQKRQPYPQHFGLPEGLSDELQTELDKLVTIPSREANQPLYRNVGSLLDLLADSGVPPTPPDTPAQLPAPPSFTTIIVASVTGRGGSGRAQADLLTSALEVLASGKTLWQKIGAMAMTGFKKDAAATLRGIAGDNRSEGIQVILSTQDLPEELRPVAAQGALALAEPDRTLAETTEGLLELRRRERVTSQATTEAGTIAASNATSLTNHTEAGARTGSSANGATDVNTNWGATRQTTTELGDFAAADASELQTIRARVTPDNEAHPEVLVVNSYGQMYVYDVRTRQPLRPFPPPRQQAPDVSKDLQDIRGRNAHAVTNADNIAKAISPTTIGPNGNANAGKLRVPNAQTVSLIDMVNRIDSPRSRHNLLRQQYDRQRPELRDKYTWIQWIDVLYDTYRQSGEFTGTRQEWYNYVYIKEWTR
ncbi:MAG TPA: hypothetical protein VLF40_03950 [Candidatus Saccharimonadales bacterium]|nr:hypothetical protein [Candidatus Saccharimonadales bacterium]